MATLPRPAARRHRRRSAALSFHETKNVICGEGGALLVNDRALRRARRDPAGEGDRTAARSSAAQVDKYTWVDVGSSYLPSEI